MESYLDFRQIFGILRKHLIFIILSIICFTLLALGTEKFLITPQYTANTQILVNQKKDSNSINSNDFQSQQADVQIISTYKDIITNQLVLSQAQKNLANPVKVIRPAQKSEYQNKNGKKELVKAAKPAVVKSTGTPYKLSIKDLQSAISITNQQNSQVFALNVETDNPKKSAAIANEVSEVFKDKIKQVMSVNNVTIVSHATPNKQKSSPNTKIILAIGLLLGIFVGLGYAFIRELMDTTIKDDDYLNNELHLLNLGYVSKIRKLKGSHLSDNNSKRSSNNQHRRV